MHNHLGKRNTKTNMAIIRPQSEFPLLERFRQIMDIDDKTIFAYGDTIYTNYEMHEDVYQHELKHLERQGIIGVDKFVEQYLYSPSFRLEEEVIAYRHQLKSIKDRGLRHAVRLDCAENLSSGMYGSLITREEALKLLL